MLTTNYTTSARKPVWCSLSVKFFTQMQTVTPILLFYFSMWMHVVHFHTMHVFFVSCPGMIALLIPISINFSNIILCPATFCKPPVHKKKPVTLPVHVHCCSECLCAGVQNIHSSYDYACCYLTSARGLKHYLKKKVTSYFSEKNNWVSNWVTSL